MSTSQGNLTQSDNHPGINASVAEAESGEGDSYLAPNSVMRKIDQEAVVLLGGGRAILLQLAHPFVAAGVDDHSNFQSEILDRLYRTLLFMQNLVFEDRRSTEKAIQQFYDMHDRIRGFLPHDAGCFPAGTPYSGRDPHAKLWVHATFVDTSLKVYQHFVSPLSRQEQESYYSDSLVLARLMDIPARILPQTLDDFNDYMESMMASDTLAVTSTARRLANAVLYPQVGIFPSISAGLLRLVTGGMLSERFRREYGLKWGWKEQIMLNSLSRSTQSLRPFVPTWVWQNPLLEGKLSYFLLWGAKSSPK